MLKSQNCGQEHQHAESIPTAPCTISHNGLVSAVSKPPHTAIKGTREDPHGVFYRWTHQTQFKALCVVWPLRAAVFVIAAIQLIITVVNVVLICMKEESVEFGSVSASLAGALCVVLLIAGICRSAVWMGVGVFFEAVNFGWAIALIVMVCVNHRDVSECIFPIVRMVLCLRYAFLSVSYINYIRRATPLASEVV